MQFETDRATIDYEEHGEGDAVLFLHGWSMDRRLETAAYEPIFAARKDLRRIYPDLPGMGRSRARRIDCQDDMLEALIAFVDGVLGRERFVLCGTSGGGYLARALAVKRRERVRGLLLNVPAVIADTAKRTIPPFQPLVRNQALLDALPKDERAALAEVLVQTPEWLDARRRVLRDLVGPAFAANAPLVAEIRADPARYAVSFDLAQAEKGFDRPTLIIAARQDRVVGYRDALGLLDSYPRATFAVVDRADHGWPVESPRLLQALVEDWLERIDRFEHHR